MSVENLIKETRTLVKEKLKGFSNPAVACSFGLDSVITLFFVREIIPRVPVIFVNSGTEYPEIYDFIRIIVKQWGLNLHTIPPKHPFRWVVARHGFPIHSRGNPFKYDSKYLPAHYCCLYLKKRPLEQYIRKNKFDVVVDGLRSEESMLRKYSIKKYGILHYHKGNRSFRFHPLAYWTRQNEIDCVNLLKIPISAYYKKTMDGIITRSGCWCCTMNWKYKRNQFLLKYYPKLWKILMVNFGFAKFLASYKTGNEISTAQAENLVVNRPCFFDTL